MVIGLSIFFLVLVAFYFTIEELSEEVKEELVIEEEPKIESRHLDHVFLRKVALITLVLI